MVTVTRALFVLALTGACSMSVGPDQPWVPIEEISGALSPELVEPASLLAEPKGPVRIVTYNVQYGPDVPGLAAAIGGDSALASGDVFLIQEIESYPGEGQSRAGQLADALGLGYVYVPARQRDQGTHGLAILSRFPITNVNRMDLPDVSQTLLHRIAIEADIDLGAVALHVIDVHLDTKLDTRERIAQLHPVVISAPDTSVVAGDFNMSWVEWAHGVPILTASASDQAPAVDSYMRALDFDTPAAAAGPTEHMYGIEQRLDAIYTRGTSTIFGGVPRVGPSDHWPMWADVTPPD
jgi:endonuclease/exonuclease/phosphatase family metal-dependent hydrolase